MTESERRIVSSFSEDLRVITRDLCKFFALKFSEEVVNLSDPLLRWMDFVTRYIDPRPRTVVASSAFPKRLPNDVARALSQMIERFASGGDVNGYQSRGLTAVNDISSGKRQLRTDLLWADWGVHHLHLSNEPVKPGSRYSARSGWLLFCIVLQDQVGLIDVKPHGEKESFAEPELVRQMFRDWPEFMSQYELKGLLSSKSKLDAHAIHELRRGGVNGPLEYKGKVYLPPGGGVTSASTPMRLTLLCDRIKVQVKELAHLVADPEGQFEQHLRSSGVQTRDFCLRLTPKGVAVLELQSLHALNLPRCDETGESWLADLHEQLFPTWAATEALKSTGQAER